MSTNYVPAGYSDPSEDEATPSAAGSPVPEGYSDPDEETPGHRGLFQGKPQSYKADVGAGSNILGTLLSPSTYGFGEEAPTSSPAPAEAEDLTPPGYSDPSVHPAEAAPSFAGAVGKAFPAGWTQGSLGVAASAVGKKITETPTEQMQAAMTIPSMLTGVPPGFAAGVMGGVGGLLQGATSPAATVMGVGGAALPAVAIPIIGAYGLYQAASKDFPDTVEAALSRDPVGVAAGMVSTLVDFSLAAPLVPGAKYAGGKLWEAGSGPREARIAGQGAPARLRADLGLAADATDAEVATAYAQALRSVHPDIRPDLPTDVAATAINRLQTERTAAAPPGAPQPAGARAADILTRPIGLGGFQPEAEPVPVAQPLMPTIEATRALRDQAAGVPANRRFGPATETAALEEAALPEVPPQEAFRTRAVGEEGLPFVPETHEGKARATTSLEEAKDYADWRRDFIGTPQEIVRIDLDKLPKDTYITTQGPQGHDWVAFTRALTPEETEVVRTAADLGHLTPEEINHVSTVGPETAGVTITNPDGTEYEIDLSGLEDRNPPPEAVAVPEGARQPEGVGPGPAGIQGAAPPGRPAEAPEAGGGHPHLGAREGPVAPPPALAGTPEEVGARLADAVRAGTIKTSLVERADLRKTPLTDAEVNAAIKEIADEAAPEPEQIVARPEGRPAEGTHVAPPVGYSEVEGHGEIVRPGEGIPGAEPAPAGGEPAERPAAEPGPVRAEAPVEPLVRFRDDASGMESRVFKRKDGRFSVTLTDLGSGQTLPTVRIFKRRLEADAEAKRVLGTFKKTGPPTGDIVIKDMTGREVGRIPSTGGEKGPTLQKEAPSEEGALRKPPYAVGAPSEGVHAEVPAEGLRGAGEGREPERGVLPGAGEREGAVREAGGAGNEPVGGAGVRPERPDLLPGTGEPGAIRERGRAGDYGGGVPEVAGEPGVPEPEHPTARNLGTDFRIADAASISAGGPRAKVKANLEAIRLLKQILAEGRGATADEQTVLAKYCGWGQFPGLFRYGTDLYDIGQEVQKLLSDEDWTAARKSVLNAHFTAPEIVSAIWRAIDRLGFKGGRVLEPSVGVGNFFGLMPPDMKGRSRLTGVELDPTTGEIARLLYPNANIQIKGFQDLKIPDGFFDLATSNVPFGDYRVHDKDYNRFGASIHDYFFLKSLDKVRPGGAVAFITSTFTMDKQDPKIRRALIEKGADLVAAIRLPAETFQKNAGTAVVTDLVILRKRLPGEAPAGPAWTELKTMPDPDGGDPIPINQYFAEHPEQILGRLDRKSKMFPGNSNVSGTEDFPARLEGAIGRLPEKVIRPAPPSNAFKPQIVQAGEEGKSGGLLVKDGKLYMRIGDTLVERKSDPQTTERIQGMLGVRDAIRAVFDAQIRGAGEAEARKALNERYDDYVKKNGRLSDPRNAKAIAEDPDAPVLMALEEKDPKTGKIQKTSVFTRVQGYAAKDTAANPGEALGISLHETGSVDLERMARLLKTNEATLGPELIRQGLAYDDPKDGWTAASQYLSGNVRRKLDEAIEAAQSDPRYAPNVQALRKVQPKDVDHLDIQVRVGSPWVPASDMVDFMHFLIGGDRDTDFTAHFVPQDGSWLFAYTSRGRTRHANREANRKIWGTERADFPTVLTSAANGRPIVVTDRDSEGNAIVNHEASAAANGKVDEVKAAFQDWIWDDPERRTRLHRYYNDNFNNIVPISYDAGHYRDAKGDYILPGQNPALPLRKIQADFVWQTVTTGRGIAAHEVGVGKTFAMTAAAMELRRLGLARKPIIATPNAVIDGFVKQARELYPNARILATGEGFDAAHRKETVARIATGDWDMVIMTHDNLDMLPMRPEVVKEFIGRELDELEQAIRASKEADPKKDNRIVKQLEKSKARLQAKLAKAIEGAKKDDALYFEDLGADHIFVDEAHKYKSLPVYTSREGIKGIPTSRSNRATNMLMRAQWLQERNNGRGVTFATGTPIANTMVELYNLQRYIQPKELKERGIQSFDAWLNTFADTKTKMEYSAAGLFKPTTRLGRFTNLNELQAIAGEVMDVQKAGDVEGLVRPAKKEEVVSVPMSQVQERFMWTIAERAKKLKGRGGKGEDNMLAISTDARKAALDMRLVSPIAGDPAESKVRSVAANVLAVHKERPDAVQVIFSDIGVHESKGGKKGFSVYRDITKKLVEGGIPRERIIDFSELSDDAKKKAVERLRTGDALIGIGSTDKLGTGVNIQDHLYALHHVDIPWLPASLEQRDGRAWRYGNENDHIRIFRYVTTGSFDTFMWQAIDNKSRFIRQYLDGDYKGRMFEDPDTEELTPAQVMAITSGSPELLEKVQLEQDILDLTRAQKRHAKLQEELKDSIRDSAQAVATRQKRIEGANEDLALAKKTEGQPFRATIAGREYTERLATVDALRNRLDQARNAYRGPVEVAEYRGMRIVGDYSSVRLEMKSGERELNFSPEQPQGIFASADAHIRALPRTIENEKDQIRTIQENAGKARAKIGEPFKGTEEIARKKARSEEVDAILAKKAEEKRAAGQPVVTEADLAAAETPEPEPEVPKGNGYYVMTSEGWKEVTGKPVAIPGFESYNFFSHKSDAGRYIVSELRSGLNVSGGSHGKLKDAVQAASDMLTKFGPEKLEKAVQGAEAKAGPKPTGPAKPEEHAMRAPKAAAAGAPEEMPAGSPVATAAPVAPAATVQNTKRMARMGRLLLRSDLAWFARRHDVEARALDSADRYLDQPNRVPGSARAQGIAQEWEAAGKKAEAKELRDHAWQMDFIDAIENNRMPADPKLAETAAYLSRAFEVRKQELIALGKDAARDWNLNYFPHIWKDPKGIRDRIRAMVSRRPMEGSKSFLKHRTFPTTFDGLDAGYVPVDWNPIRLSLLKMAEMDKYITARRFLATLHERGIPQYVRVGQKTPDGFRVPKDPMFQVHKSPEIEVKEAYDEQLMKSLTDWATELGATVTTKRSLGRGKWGAAYTSAKTAEKTPPRIERRFGGPETILTHEIGHVLDDQYRLYERMTKGNETVKRELSDLAKYRQTDPEDFGFAAYVQNPDEQIANLVHAFVHTPDLLKQVAPETDAAFRRLIDQTPDLKPILTIKPSLKLAEARGIVHAGGIVTTGAWAVPTPIADILDRHLGPSIFAGSTFFDVFRKANMALLMARLGWSGFHLGFTTGDVTLSRLALAGVAVSRGDLAFAGKEMARIPSVFSGWFKENPYMAEWYAPGTQGEEIGAIVKALEMGGMRARQGGVYNLGNWDNFFRDLRKEGIGNEPGALRTAADVGKHPLLTAKVAFGHPLRSFGALVEMGSRYVLNTIVPRQKMAVAAELAEEELRTFQKETGAATLKDALAQTDPIRVKDAMAKVVDVVDDRLGQIIYDNAFINRTFRDCLHASIQSVGWNWGTARVALGGIKDVGQLFGEAPEDIGGKKIPRISHRLAYLIALPFFHAMISSIIQYLYTGKSPEEWKDLVFPKNGRTNPDGSAARLAPATYMKDFYAYLSGFDRGVTSGVEQIATTLQHKTAPIWSVFADLRTNQDFYGTMIRDKNAPIGDQLMQLAKYLVTALTPYSASGYKRERRLGASKLGAAPSFFGLTPASAAVTRTPLEADLYEYGQQFRTKGGRTPEQAERSAARFDIQRAVREGDVEAAREARKKAEEQHLLSPRQLTELSKRAAQNSQVRRFEAINDLREAIRIFKEGTPEEKARLAPSLRKKMRNRTGISHLAADDRMKVLKEAQALIGATP